MAAVVVVVGAADERGGGGGGGSIAGGEMGALGSVYWLFFAGGVREREGDGVSGSLFSNRHSSQSHLA